MLLSCIVGIVGSSVFDGCHPVHSLPMLTVSQSITEQAKYKNENIKKKK